MTLKQNLLRRRIKRGSSLATSLGLLAASAATLIGTYVGLEPDVILWRAAVSGIVVGVLMSFGLSVIYVANATN
ncbi:MAG TPA: hypothetical protein PKD64_01785 [Pirellulaceae bacterium]|nr:hypothetical protein [Pirellulaceae bacterium]HMO90901.1 hypothetical protein [Pirellulaceae bacterium]HMP68623.1 hypothetical protein [Pirellulaceae bacterium]